MARQLLRGSALVPHISTLKLMLMHYWKGGCSRERNCCIPRISPPPVFCTKAKVAKDGERRICGTLQYMHTMLEGMFVTSQDKFRPHEYMKLQRLRALFAVGLLPQTFSP